MPRVEPGVQDVVLRVPRAPPARDARRANADVVGPESMRSAVSHAGPDARLAQSLLQSQADMASSQMMYRREGFRLKVQLKADGDLTS